MDRATGQRDPSLPLALLLAAGACLFRIRALASPDAWWHLSGGRAVLEAGARSYDDPLAVAPTEPFVNAEWGFDLLCLGLYRLAGAPGLVGLSALCAGASCLLVYLAVRDWGGVRDGWRALVVAGLVAGVTTVRFFPRPQILFLVLLPAVLWTTRRALATVGRARLAAVLATWLLVAIWAQVHLSVAVAPAVVALAALPGTLGRRAPDEPSVRPDRWLLLAGLPVLLLPLTGASGAGIVGQVTGHSSGDAIRHIADMQPMLLEWLLPPEGPDLALLELLVLAAVVGLVVSRRLPLGPTLLLVLGLVMMMRSHRFAAAAAVLAAPLAHTAWAGTRRGIGPVLAVACCALGLASAGRGWSPSVGLDRAHVPVDLGRAVDALELSGPGFNDYDAGGFLGWTRYGRARVFIDGRTPIFFDDERYFAARTALRDPGAFERLHEVHRFEWVVIRREVPLCRALDESRSWGAAWIDQERALFLPAGGRPLAAFDPCSDEATLASCRATGFRDGWELELELLFELVPDAAWAHRIGALLGATCGSPDLEAAAAHLESAAAADPDAPELPWVAARVFLAAGDVERAVAWLESAPPEDRRARATLAGLLVSLDRPSDARRVAEGLLHELGDEAPAELRGVLADACRALGDDTCAEEQRWRADPAADGVDSPPADLPLPR